MIYIFDDFELDTRLYELRHAGEAVALEPLAFKALVYLVQQRDHAVSKDELIEHLWPGQFMKDWVLVQSVVKARKAIGDNGQEQRCIKTVTGYGYRFIAPVEEYDVVGHEAQPRAPTPMQPEVHKMVLSRDLAPQQGEEALALQELPMAGRVQELAMLRGLFGQVEDDQGEIVVLVIRLGAAQTVPAKRDTQCVKAALHALRSYTTETMPGFGVAPLEHLYK